MLMLDLPGGWQLMGMAQIFGVVTTLAPFQRELPLAETRWALPQSAAMINLESPTSTFALRFTPNFEGLTLPQGELTPGGWGEGYIDARHPHTLIHELMLSWNLWDLGPAALSLSAGKGFAPYGTDDPMARPVLKYPTNHHLSQILERWTLNAILLWGGWGVEAGLFGGAEPEGPYDLSNITSFGDSWSARLSRRFGPGFGPAARWEASLSYARVQGVDGAEAGITALYNGALRYDRSRDSGGLYALVEASLSQPESNEGFFSILGEVQPRFDRHLPYYRLEFATRPEFAREGPVGSQDFFRYDHHAPDIGATRWLINTLGYGLTLSRLPLSVRAFAEVQHAYVSEARGDILPEELLGTNAFWSASLGLRLYFGGGPMRMGSYGILDPMSAAHRSMNAMHEHRN
ncbi:hypothetical protein DL240_15545 [Lujinxingia litoralis]|uniref:Bacterial surface antigen (D15) domain-containing protein n=2 Tax=Lujinxingia litoralis TaxID=2211119 RepID=A0A328C298_9DELT|nr:hypothetical protein DL240_15545 [Lujinxingia litoralis]